MSRIGTTLSRSTTILEHEIAPRFYDGRNAAGVPEAWVQICKEAIATVAPAFSMRRMLTEYMQELYMPAATHPAQSK